MRQRFSLPGGFDVRQQGCRGNTHSSNCAGVTCRLIGQRMFSTLREWGRTASCSRSGPTFMTRSNPPARTLQPCAVAGQPWCSLDISWRRRRVGESRCSSRLSPEFDWPHDLWSISLRGAAPVRKVDGSRDGAGIPGALGGTSQGTASYLWLPGIRLDSFLGDLGSSRGHPAGQRSRSSALNSRGRSHSLGNGRVDRNPARSPIRFDRSCGQESGAANDSAPPRSSRRGSDRWAARRSAAVP